MYNVILTNCIIIKLKIFQILFQNFCDFWKFVSSLRSIILNKIWSKCNEVQLQLDRYKQFMSKNLIFSNCAINFFFIFVNCCDIDMTIIMSERNKHNIFNTRVIVYILKSIKINDQKIFLLLKINASFVSKNSNIMNKKLLIDIVKKPFLNNKIIQIY